MRYRACHVMLLTALFLHSAEWLHFARSFAEEHAFEKPNDVRALDLMDKCATVSSQACLVCRMYS